MVTKDSYEGSTREMAYLTYDLYFGASMPIASIIDMPSNERSMFEEELREAMTNVFKQYGRKYR